MELFESSEPTRNYYAGKFRFVMVDESQDTNRPQYLLIKRLSEQYRNLAVVGDPDQSIYKWRGADLKNILDFEHDFPEAAVVKLEQNYRSTQVILDAATAVISQNRNRKDKRLWTDQRAAHASSISAATTSSKRRTSSRVRSSRRGRPTSTRWWRSSTAPTPSHAPSKTR